MAPPPAARSVIAAAVAALVATVVAGCAGGAPHRVPAPPPARLEANWFDCRQDDDCALIRDPSCSFVSVNRSHAAALVDYVADHLTRRGALRECEPYSIAYAPLCRDAKCSQRPLAPTALPGGR